MIIIYAELAKSYTTRPTDSVTRLDGLYSRESISTSTKRWCYS